MVANGDTEVNALRAKRCSAVALTAQQAAVHHRPRCRHRCVDNDESAIVTSADEADQPADAIVSLFVQLDDDRVVADSIKPVDGREGRGRHC